MPTEPVLTDGVVTLRAHTDDDIDDIVTMCADPESPRWTTAIPIPYRREDAEKWLYDLLPADREKGAFHWAIEALDGSTPRFAGNVGIHAGPPPEIGYVAAPWARGRGYMSRAVRLVTRWGFDVAKLPVVQWKAIVGNIASWRVAHASGFIFHGTVPQSLAQRGELRDGWYGSLRPDDDQTPQTTWWRVPELHGTRVRLRAHAEADIPRIVEACSADSTQRWLAHLPRPYTEESAREFVAGRELSSSLGQSVTWAITAVDDDRLLANITIFKLDDVYLPTGGEIGYTAHPDARGRGVVGEAVELVVKHAFTPVADGGLGRHRLQIGAAWSNTASRRVAERAGFTLVGHYHQDGVIGVDRDELDDGAWYELLVPGRSPHPVPNGSARPEVYSTEPATRTAGASSAVLQVVEQPASITYADKRTHFVALKSIEPRGGESFGRRTYEVWAGSDPSVNYGHVVELQITGARPTRIEADWSGDGVLVRFPSGHTLFLPASSFTGGR